MTVTDDRRQVTGILTAGAVVRVYRDAVRAPLTAAESRAASTPSGRTYMDI